MPPSTGIQPKSGYNFVLFDYLGPQTNLAVVDVYDKPSGGAVWAQIDHNTKALKYDLHQEYTSAAGVTIDTSGGIGVRVKDGGVRLQNNVALSARNAANTADVNLISLDGSNLGTLDSTAFAWRDWSGSVAYSCNGSMTITGTSTQWFRYKDLGNMVFLDFGFVGTLGGTASDEVRATLPIASVTTGWTPCYANPSPTMRIGMASVQSGSLLRIFQPTLGNWTLGAIECRGQIFYSK